MNGQTSALPTPASPALTGAPALTVGGQTIAPSVVSGTPVYSIAPGQTVTAGGSPITVGGSTISVATSGSAIVVNGATTPLSQAFSGAAAPSAAGLTLNGQTYTPTTVSGTPVYSIAPGETLTPGGSALTVSGSTISLAPSGSAVVVNGQTSTLPTVGAGQVTSAPALTINGQTYAPTTVSGTTEYSVAPGRTLVPGGAPITVGGTTISLSPSGTAAVINGQTSNLPPPTTGVGSYVASGVGATGTGGPQQFTGEASKTHFGLVNIFLIGLASIVYGYLSV